MLTTYGPACGGYGQGGTSHAIGWADSQPGGPFSGIASQHVWAVEPRAHESAGRIVYSLGSNPAERDRLRRQSAELRDHSALLLDRVGVAEGWRAIDLGCGPSGILDLLADRIGPAGRVVGLDLEPANVALARELAAERGLANVEVMQGDAHRTGLPSASYDLVHARTLLINIPDPAAVVAEMVRLARPGGWVAVLEPDGGGSVCYPAHPAWDRLTQIFFSAQQLDGADTFIGRRLPELFRRPV